MIHKEDTQQLPELLSIRQAAKALGIGESGVVNAIQRGKLQSMRFDTVTLIPRSAVEHYKANRKRGRPVGWRKEK